MASKAMPSLGMVSPEEWVRRTKVLIGRRGESMLKVDAAYEQYYRDRSQGNSQKLHAALDSYLKEKGGHWSKLDRNKNSGGLMQAIYNLTQVKENVLEKRIPESRHGVLYLWANTSVFTQRACVLLEGGFDLFSPIMSLPAAGGRAGLSDLELSA